MKRKILLLITIIILDGTLHAQPYKIGLGIKFGEPAGLDGKFFLSESGALEVILGQSGYVYHGYRYRIDNDVVTYKAGPIFSLGINYLIHRYDLFPGADNLLLYYGFGGLLGVNDVVFGVSAVGVIGLDLYFVSVPFGLSLDLMPGITFPYLNPYFGGGLGLRWLLSR